MRAATLPGPTASLGTERNEPVPVLKRRIGIRIARLVLVSGSALALGACARAGMAAVRRSGAAASSRALRLCHALRGALDDNGTATAVNTDVFEHGLEEARAAAATRVPSSPNPTLAADARAYKVKVDAFAVEARAAGVAVAHPYPAGLRALESALTFYSQAGPWVAPHCIALPKSFDVHVNV